MYRRSFFAAALLLAGMSCKEATPIGQLVVSFQTDMALPQQVDTVRVQITAQGERLLDQDYPVGRADHNPIPGTLTLVAGDDPTVPVTIRVAAAKRGDWRTFREVVTQIPPDRTASLRMPIQWLCDGTAKTGSERDDAGRLVVSSTCGAGNSCVAGRCVLSETPAEQLPDYDARHLFGGSVEPSQGTCFDTVACMAAGLVVEPRSTDCSLPRPTRTDRLNLALRVPSDGICDPKGESCFVPLDANSADGWVVSADGTRLVLPTAVCEKLRRGAVSAVYLSEACTAKSEAIPPCGDWSNVKGATTTPAASPMGPGEAPPAMATKLLSLGSNGLGLPCCPLIEDGGRLYTCQCVTRASSRLVAIDKAARSATPILALAVSGNRQSAYFAAAIRNGILYFVDAVTNSIHRDGVAGKPKEGFDPVRVPAEITEATPILAEGGAVYVLASAVVGAQGEAVQLLRIEPEAGSIRATSVQGNYHVYQFAQDDAFVYVVSDTDARLDDAAPIVRRSRVLRIAKLDGAVADVAPPVSVSTPLPLYGGYLGVHVDRGRSGKLYSVFEQPDEADTMVTTVLSIDPSSQVSTPLMRRTLTQRQTRLQILDVIDGAVLVARLEQGTDGQIKSSSVMLLPADGGPPRVLADFLNQSPLIGLPSVAVDESSVYWLNTSGDVYAFPRSGLR